MDELDVDEYIRGRLGEAVTSLRALLDAGRFTTREAAVRTLARQSFKRADLLRDMAATREGEASALLLDAAVLIEEHPEDLDPPTNTMYRGTNP